MQLILQTDTNSFKLSDSIQVSSGAILSGNKDVFVKLLIENKKMK